MAKKGKKDTKKKSNGGLIFGGIIVVLIVVVGAALLMGGSGENKGTSRGSVDAFAQCLTENGAVMYGAFWCPHCARTKKNFGSSFSYITYVECDPRGENEQSEVCILKGIDAYDTWEFSDGSRVIGEPTFEILSEKTGCEVPA